MHLSRCLSQSDEQHQRTGLLSYLLGSRKKLSHIQTAILVTSPHGAVQRIQNDKAELVTLVVHPTAGLDNAPYIAFQ